MPINLQRFFFHSMGHSDLSFQNIFISVFNKSSKINNLVENILMIFGGTLLFWGLLPMSVENIGKNVGKVQNESAANQRNLQES